jgi:hypothetical protein
MEKMERLATLLKIQQLERFRRARGCSYAEVSRLFDEYDVWGFIDDSYEALHVQGVEASFADISGYLETRGVLV